jgi:hypothetical protein
MMSGTVPSGKRKSTPGHVLGRKCAAAITARLHALGLTHVQKQAPVMDPFNWMVHTHADLLCTTRNGKLCVVEIKTTQKTIATHDRVYRMPDKKNPRLKHTAMPNSDYVHHQMQARSGAYFVVACDTFKYTLCILKGRPVCPGF